MLSGEALSEDELAVESVVIVSDASEIVSVLIVWDDESELTASALTEPEVPELDASEVSELERFLESYITGEENE